MYKKVLVLLVLMSSVVFASHLKYKDGFIKAHTQVFMDPNIDPITSSIESKLQMTDGITSIKGDVDIYLDALKSEGHGSRDEHMHELLEVQKNNKAVYSISKVSKNETGYLIDGVLKLHGVENKVSMQSEIIENENNITLKGNTSFNMSSFGLEPPSMFFFTVRDRIDIFVDLILAKD